MTGIGQINALYDCARECEIWDQPVEHCGVQAFITSATALLRGLSEAQSSALWRPAALVLRRARRLICTVPLPFSDPALRLGDAAGQLERQAQHLDGIADTSQIQVLSTAAAELSRLAACDDDPLGCCVRDFITLDDPAEGIVVIGERCFADSVAAAMTVQGVAVRVGSQADLAGRVVYGSAALAGPPGWIRPGVLNAPRARNVVLVHYNFFSESPETEPLLYGPAASSSVIRPIHRSEPWHCGGSASAAVQQEVDVLPSECHSAEEISLALASVPPGGRLASAREQVTARVALLADGSHVLLPVTAEPTVVVVGLEFPPDVSVEQTPAGEITQGAYVALRHRSHHQDVIDRANALLGAEAAALRATQQLWKDLLWQQVVAHRRGIRGVAEELREMGAGTANVGYWVSSWCIRPRSKQDFTVVMRRLGLAAEAEETWQRLRRIDSAHHSAGQRYIKDLQQAIAPEYAERLAAAGWCAITPEGGGETLLARIEQILPGLCQVPVSVICRLRTSQDLP